jgi:hypothetical protein
LDQHPRPRWILSLFFDANGTLVREVDTNFGGPFPASISGNGTTLTSVATFAHLITFNATILPSSRFGHSTLIRNPGRSPSASKP